MKKLILSSGTIISIKIADAFWDRLIGLIGTSFLAKNQGLLISPCNSIHMIGMKFPIDVIYVDKNLEIIKVVEGVRPWYGWSVCLKADSVIELGKGTVSDNNIHVGEKIKIE